MNASDLGGGWPGKEDAAGTAAWRNELGGGVGGPVVQAGVIYGDVRIASTPQRCAHDVPEQLPTAPVNFTGRSTEVAALESLARDPEVRCPPALVVIVGSGGLGKTSLASYWLRSASDRYPDGMLFAELGGQDPVDAERPTDVIAGFLRTLGVAPDSIPATVSQRAALFRSVTMGKRVAVFLDNAASAAQVRALLPGAGPAPEGRHPWSSLVLVTTRWRLTGLAVEGARFLEIGPFGEPAGREAPGAHRRRGPRGRGGRRQP